MKIHESGADFAVGIRRTGRWREATNGQGRKAKCGQNNDALHDKVRESAGVGNEGPADQVCGLSLSLTLRLSDRGTGFLPSGHQLAGIQEKGFLLGSQSKEAIGGRSPGLSYQPDG